MRETWVRSLGWEDPLEKGMATPSSVLAWKIPRREEPGGLQSTGLQEAETTERLTRARTHKKVVFSSVLFDFQIYLLYSGDCELSGTCV